MKRSSLAVHAALLIVSIVALTAVVHAQFGASIQGTVSDKSGAVVSGANVTVTDQSTSISHSTVTDAGGFYRINELPPGIYTVDVQAGNFKKSSRTDVVVSAERPTPFDITLDTGSANETVTVTANQESLQTEDASIQGTLTSLEVESLPALNRDPYELLRLAPGVFGDGARFGDGRSGGFPNGSGAISASAGPGGSNTAIFQIENQQPISAMGQRITSNDYLVDGVSVNSLQWGGAAVITPSIESVQEQTVLSNDYDASDGRSSGAHIKTVTKSGTNALHGGGLFLYHDPNFNAFNKFSGYNVGVGFTPPVRNQDSIRQFAGTLGGPIIKNKVFFFFSYEGARAKTTTYENDFIDTADLDSKILAARSGTPVATVLQSSGIRPRVAHLLPTTCDLWIAANQPCAVVNGGIDIGSVFATYGTYNPSFTGGDPAQFAGGGLDTSPDLVFAQIGTPATTSGDQYDARVDYTRGKDFFAVNAFLTYLHTLFRFCRSTSAAHGRLQT